LRVITGCSSATAHHRNFGHPAFVRVLHDVRASRPGGNVTGISNFSEILKRNDLHLLVPKARIFAWLVNPSNFETAPAWKM
jgi:hypothetical protein